jgi:S1-C subfamily serine protease
MRSQLRLATQLFLLLATVALGASQRVSAQDRSETYFRGALWSVEVISNQGQRIGCSAKAQLSSDLHIGLLTTTDRKWLAVFTPTARFRPNQKWDMKWFVDGRQVSRSTIEATPNGAGFVESVPLSAINALSVGRLLEVRTSSWQADVMLSGSAEAIEQAQNCIAEVLREQIPRSESGPEKKQTNGPQYSSGSGFFVSRAGQVLTNSHVVRGCSKIGIARQGQPLVGARVSADDPTNDLAILETGLSETPKAFFRSGVRTGEAVFVYGFPLAGRLPSTGNFTIGNVTATAGINDDTRMLQISAPVQPGNSGGPVIDDQGIVMGVVVGKFRGGENTNFAIKSDVADTFLRAHGIPLELPPQAFKGPGEIVTFAPPELAEIAKGFTVFVLCAKE